MSKFTPGPWTWSLQRARNGTVLGCVVDCANGRICWPSRATAAPNEGRPGDDPENVANARLIATAPELYEELSYLIEIADDAMRQANNDGAEWERDVVLAPARAALAKVQGSPTCTSSGSSDTGTGS